MIENLTNLIQQTNKKKLFVGIGNVLKSDDGIGVFISNNITESESTQKLTVEVSIENYIGKINSLKPDVLILVDCVEFGKHAGYYELLPVEKVKDFTVNTHNISLKRISELFNMPTYILGIQPKQVDFGEKISEKVLNTAKKILEIINQ
ncbi:hydrogenase maturation protease [Bacteroidota bacterium]